ncbi:hypothetical protein BGZ96_004819 [Linnemannia gamsii]|uniref:Uncharacterized protein n=1 Tax=Linnemannia gamsii TaxID=64522 RepID=A0ABQ7JIF6_9FUNG|nr:hypothetical protein BGZ96_004819 [Linnemannia gamsii]
MIARISGSKIVLLMVVLAMVLSIAYAAPRPDGPTSACEPASVSGITPFGAALASITGSKGAWNELVRLLKAVLTLLKSSVATAPNPDVLGTTPFGAFITAITGQFGAWNQAIFLLEAIIGAIESVHE